MNLLGIDIGTSSVKIIHKHPNGSDTYIRLNTSINIQSGFSEQDPNQWWNNVLDIFKEISSKTEKIDFICLTGQMHSLVVLDDNDEVVRNAILWNDQRTTKETDYINEKTGTNALVSETGNIMLTGFTLPKLLWLRNNEPSNYSLISKMFMPKDFIAYKLTGRHCTDVSDASGTGLLNISTRNWSSKMIKDFDINEQILGEVLESQTKVGTVSNDEVLNLIGQATVIIGGGDQAMSAIGTGVISNNEISVSLGTSGVVFQPSAQTIPKNNSVHYFCDANFANHCMGVMLSCGSTVDWLTNNIIHSRNYKDLCVNTNEADKDIYFIPYLSGERCPVNNPNAKGIMYGLDLSTNEADITRATLEGISFSIRSIFDELTITGNPTICLTGGVAKNEFVVQNLQKLINYDFKIIYDECGPALGCIIFCHMAANDITLEQAIKEIICNFDIKPSLTSSESLETKYKTWKDIYQRLEPLSL